MMQSLQTTHQYYQYTYFINMCNSLIMAQDFFGQVVLEDSSYIIRGCFSGCAIYRDLFRIFTGVTTVTRTSRDLFRGGCFSFSVLDDDLFIDIVFNDVFSRDVVRTLIRGLPRCPAAMSSFVRGRLFTLTSFVCSRFRAGASFMCCCSYTLASSFRRFWIALSFSLSQASS